MENELSRLELLIGTEKIEKLKNTHIAVFGIGGVGGYVVEALVRSGIGKITIIDNDVINISNLNRQIIALNSTLKLKKVDIIEKRILDINPNCTVNKFDVFFDENNSDTILNNNYDYVIDAIDSFNSKIHLIKCCLQKNIPIISSMGTGNKLNPLDLKIADISKTNTCPLAKKVRHELRLIGIKHLKVLFSTETPIKINRDTNVVGSTAFVPGCAGLILASEVIKDILK